LGRVQLGLGQPARAQAAATEALRLAERIGDEDGVSNAFATLGLIAQAEGQLAEAARAFTESYAHARQTRQASLTCLALVNLAEIARVQGDTERTTALLDEALGHARSASLRWTIATITTLLGHVARQQQDYPAAKARYRESLSLYRAFASPTYAAWCLEGFAAALSAEGRYPQATRLCGAAAALREQAQTPLPSAEQVFFEQTVAGAKAALDADRFNREWLAGSALGMNEAIDYALSPECA
jgi:tetratricopeptide (TPR) repeat protein